MTRKYQLQGERFGNWKVLERRSNGNWLCQCDCGTQKIIRTSNLVRGATKSCGCARPDRVRVSKQDMVATTTVCTKFGYRLSRERRTNLIRRMAAEASRCIPRGLSPSNNLQPMSGSRRLLGTPSIELISTATMSLGTFVGRRTRLKQEIVGTRYLFPLAKRPSLSRSGVS